MKERIIQVIVVGVLLAIITVLLASCSPGKFDPFRPPEVNAVPTKKYEFESPFEKPSAPKKILLDKDFKVTTVREEAKYIAFDPTEFAKIVVLNKLYNAQEEIINDHVKLVNVHIETINALKDLLALKDAEVNEYISLWANAENAYREEKHTHTLDNAINKTAMYIVTIGSIVLLAIGL